MLRGDMIVFDRIINSLQKNGGVTVYFKEILERINRDGILCKYTANETRFFGRYRDCCVDTTSGVFHSSYYRLPKKPHGCKVLTTVHDFTYEKFVQGPALWIHSWQKNRAIKNSDLIICVSHNTALDLMRYCPVEASRIRVIYNGVSDTYYPLPEKQRQYGNKVLFVGARGGYKNFLLAVKAVARQPSLALHIVGGGVLSSSEVRLLEQQLPGRYQWLGRLSDEELNIAYNSAYVLLYPSSYEGFGIPIIEAMRAGCPVIAVNASSIPEVAGNAAIMVDAASVEALDVALQILPRQRDSLVAAGYAQAAKFSWERCYQETLAVYNELI